MEKVKYVVRELIKIVAPIVMMLTLAGEFFYIILSMFFVDSSTLLDNFYCASFFLAIALVYQFACKIEIRAIVLYLAYFVLMLFQGKIPANIYLANGYPIPVAMRLCVFCVATLPVIYQIRRNLLLDGPIRSENV